MTIPLPEPTYWQWRYKSGQWYIDGGTFDFPVHTTTDDTEIRTLYTADQLRAYGDARSAELLAVAKRRADHESSAAAHYAGTWYQAHDHHLTRYKAMHDLIDAVWPDATLEKTK